MANMRAARDTFLHYLADNLSSYTVHNLRVDKANPSLNEIEVDAINVTFHNSDLVGPSQLSDQLVTVDVIFENELDAIACAEQVGELLFTAAYAPLLDYTNPASPVQIGDERMFWKLALNFKTVHAENFFHLSALLHLCVHFT